MSDELAILYQVQQADGETARLRESLADLDTGEDLQAQVAAGEAELAALRSRHHNTEKESLALDLELKTLEEKRDKFNRQLHGGTVRNPRQLGDLEKEVEMLRREIGRIEERVLELMELQERERVEIEEKEAQLADLRGRLEAVRAGYQTTGTRLRAEIGELETRRQELAAGVAPQLLKRYDQIRARQGNLGLVKVTGDSCPGCRITLPLETLKVLKAERRALTCENCGRLLLWNGPAS